MNKWTYTQTIGLCTLFTLLAELTVDGSRKDVSYSVLCRVENGFGESLSLHNPDRKRPSLPSMRSGKSRLREDVEHRAEYTVQLFL